MTSPSDDALAGSAAEPVPSGNPYVAAVAALLLPGAGHFYLGRRARAVLFGAIVVTSVVLGCALHGKLQSSFDSPFNVLGTLGSMGSGVLYFLLRFVLDYQGDVRTIGYEYGTTFLMTAGLMNLLLALDSWDIAVGRKR